MIENILTTEQTELKNNANEEGSKYPSKGFYKSTLGLDPSLHRPIARVCELSHPIRGRMGSST